MKRKIRVSALAAAFVLLWGAAAQAEVAIETSVSRSRAAVGEEIVLDFIITNASGAISKPTFPPLDGFTSYSQGHSQEIMFVNGRTTSKSVFTYILIPNSSGKKTLGPFEINIGGKPYKVAPIEIDVTPQGTASGPPATYTTSAVASPSPRALPQGQVGDQDIFVRAWLDKDEVYVNEPAMLTYTLYTRLSATYKGFEKEPVTTGFWVEDFPPEKTIKRTEQVLNNSRYVVADVRKLALFPTEAGVYTLDPGVLSAVVEIRNEEDFNSFFSYNIFGRRSSQFPQTFVSQVVQKTLPADKTTLVVKALPEAGKPASFTGAVGQYRIESSLDRDDVEAGTPVTFRVRLKGQGNLNTVKTPSLPPLEDFKIYDSSTSSNITKDRLIVEGEKVTETVIVPKKAGDYTVPAVEFSYFDPSTASYRTLKTEPRKLTVRPGSDEAAETEAATGVGVQPVEKENLSLTGKDIRYIKMAAPRPWLLPKDLHRRPLYWFVDAVLAALAVLLTAMAGRKPDARGALAARIRRSGQAARRRLRTAEQKMKAGKQDDFYAETSKAVHGYFADKLGLAPQIVTFEKIEQHAAEAPPQALNELRELLQDLGMGRFGRVEHGPEAMRKVYEKAGRVLTAFEKVKLQ
ncbi:MAG TPA: BatD family protein [Candidatus Eisenbacteria bacterium]|nr:BatD family protein [Candidatus Eisenbacteria bacterium]